MQKNQVIPLLLPKPSGSLLILGWDDCLIDTDFTCWHNILIYSKQAIKNESKFTFVHNILKQNYHAVLVLSASEFKNFQRSNQLLDVPFSYLGKYCSTFNHLIRKTDSYLLYGHPFTNPLYWFSYRNDIKNNNRLIYDTNALSPRGRFDLYVLFIDKLFRKFIPANITTHYIICDASFSVLGKQIHRSNPAGCLLQNTKTGKFILLNSNTVTKIVHLNKNTNQAVNNPDKTIITIPNSKNITDVYPESEIIWQDNFEMTEEKFFPGLAAYKYLGDAESLSTIFNNTSDVLLQWYGETTSVIIDEQWLLQNVISLQHAIKKHLNLTYQKKMDGILEILIKRLSGQEIAKVPEHGDLWLNNIIVNPDSLDINGIIDWDFTKTDGLPFMDIYHLLSWRTSRFQADLSPRKLLTPEGKYRNLLLRYAKKLDFPEILLNEFYAIYWLQNTNKMLDCGIEKTVGFKLLYTNSLDGILRILCRND